MGGGDQERWDAIWAARGAHGEPSRVMMALAPWLPSAGRALDVAGGAGRNGVWLASRGLDVTVVDVSEVAVAEARAAGLQAVRCDLEEQALPQGPWDVILVSQYLQRSLFPALIDGLAPGGVLVVVHPTMRNLERHPKPSARFLLEEGELRRLVAGLEPLVDEEGWSVEGRHEAVFVGRSRLGAPTE